LFARSTAVEAGPIRIQDEPITIGAAVFWGVTALIGGAIAYRVATSKDVKIELDIKKRKIKGEFHSSNTLPSQTVPALTLPGVAAGPVSVSVASGLTGSAMMNAQGAGSILASGLDPISYSVLVDTLFVIDPETDLFGDSLRVNLDVASALASITQVPSTFGHSVYNMSAALVGQDGSRFPILSEVGQVSGTNAQSVSFSGARSVLLNKNDFPASIPFSQSFAVDLSLSVAGDANVTPEPASMLLLGSGLVAMLVARRAARRM
jgi:hypothetical protein